VENLKCLYFNTEIVDLGQLEINIKRGKALNQEIVNRVPQYLILFQGSINAIGNKQRVNVHPQTKQHLAIVAYRTLPYSLLCSQCSVSSTILFN
jgi:hypothetical protein